MYVAERKRVAKEMVARAELAAHEARLKTEQRIAAARGNAATEANRRQMVEINARTNLAAGLAAIQTESKVLNDDLADKPSRGVAGDCAVDPDLRGRRRGLEVRGRQEGAGKCRAG